jgi:ribosome maturation factor RimP
VGQPDAVASAIEPVLTARGLEVVDVELTGAGRARMLRVVVDRDGGVDLDGLTAATEVIAPLLDGVPQLSGPYTLEVTSPGLERSLRRPDHFRRALGETVVVKTPEPRRHRGTLTAADETGVVVDVDGESVRLEYDVIMDARTRFEWGPAPKPGKGSRAAGERKRASANERPEPAEVGRPHTDPRSRRPSERAQER